MSALIDSTTCRPTKSSCGSNCSSIFRKHTMTCSLFEKSVTSSAIIEKNFECWIQQALTIDRLITLISSFCICGLGNICLFCVVDRKRFWDHQHRANSKAGRNCCISHPHHHRNVMPCLAKKRIFCATFNIYRRLSCSAAACADDNNSPTSPVVSGRVVITSPEVLCVNVSLLLLKHLVTSFQLKKPQ